jgi:L-ascorbate metabolism protein UlaG (beta-lactamase superfamily)
MKTGSSYALFLMGMSTTEDNVFYVTNQGQKTIYTSGKWTLKDLFRQGVDKFIDTEALLNPTRKE